MVETKLDYAFLADFAQVVDNKLTAVGASYTYLLTHKVPAQHMLSVAGRVRASSDVQVVPLHVEVEGPDAAYSISVDLELEGAGQIRPYDGKIGFLFAVTLPIPLVSTGLYSVYLDVNGERQRRLAFEVQTHPSAE